MFYLFSKDLQFKLEGFRNSTSYTLSYESSQSINQILKELKDQQRTHEAALRMIKQRLSTNNSNKKDTNNKELQMRGSYRSLRTNPYLNNLPTIYANNDANVGEPLIPNIRSSTYDSTFSAEEIRLVNIFCCFIN